MYRACLCSRRSISVIFAAVFFVTPTKSEPQIVNGTPTLSFDSVGALLIGNDADEATIRCSGTLIGCETFLTANHCVQGYREPSSYHVFFQSEGTISVKDISPAHDQYYRPYADLVVLKLNRAVRAAIPMTLNSPDSGVDTSGGEIVGFGYTGENTNDYGIKRSGEISTATCNDGRDGLICWNYEGVQSTTCNIDSGGPLVFRDPGDKRMLGGVASNASSQCSEPFQSVDVDVRSFLGWIREKGGSDVGQLSCGSRARTLSSDLGFSDGERTLSPGAIEVHKYEIPRSVGHITVALNGEGSPKLNFDLDANIRKPDFTVSETCGAHGKGNFASCEFFVDRDDRFVEVAVSLDGNQAGRYQLTVTALPSRTLRVR